MQLLFCSVMQSSTLQRRLINAAALLLSSLVIASLAAPAVAQDSPLPSRELSWSLSDFEQTRTRLDARNTRVQFAIGSRMDELVEDAELELIVRTSPLLQTERSQLVLRLNGETVGARALSHEGIGSDGTQAKVYRFQVPPHYFSTYNEFTVELIPEQAGDVCDINTANAWVELSGASELRLTKRRLRLENELAFLPEPFVDERDFDAVELHFLSAGSMSTDKARALAIMASYLGVHASWRELQVDYTQLDTRDDWPQQHTVLVANTDELAQLAALGLELPERLEDNAQQGQVLFADNPQHGAFKVLVVTAGDDTGLRETAATLAVTEGGLSGPLATLNPAQLAPRAAYSAPRWVSTKREVRFNELVDHPSELQRQGHRPAPINLNLRLPPDLFTWQRYGIPIDLRFRYTPPLEETENRLLVSVNGQFTQAYQLGDSGQQGSTDRVRIPLVSSAQDANRLQLPAFQLSTINNLSFQYSFARRIAPCGIDHPDSAMGVIDGNSSIDLRGYQHYTAMPNLHLFVKAGYPFSRYDDLSQTLIATSDLSHPGVMLTLLESTALIGRSTGYPTTHVEIADLATSSAEQWPVADNDLLVIGRDALNAYTQTYGDETLQKQLAGHRFAGTDSPLRAGSTTFIGQGSQATLVAFESPVSPQRSVVALAGSDANAFEQLREIIRSQELNDQVQGFMTLVSNRRIQTFDTRSPYYVGELSWWSRLQYHVAQHPVLVTFFALLAVIAIALLLYSSLARLAQRRTQGVSKGPH